MRYGALRHAGGALALLAALPAAGGCAMFGSNKGEVCEAGRQAVAEYVAEVKRTRADDPAAWKAVTDKLATRLDKLAATSDDGKVRDALKQQAAGLRAAAPAVAQGDASALNKSLTDLPARIGDACA